MKIVSTLILASAGSSGSLAVVSAEVVAGSAELPVYVTAPDLTQFGAYLVPSGNFIGTWSLSRRSITLTPVAEIRVVKYGDETFFGLQDASPIARLTRINDLTVTLTSCHAGNLTLSMVH